LAVLAVQQIRVCGRGHRAVDAGRDGHVVRGQVSDTRNTCGCWPMSSGVSPSGGGGADGTDVELVRYRVVVENTPELEIDLADQSQCRQASSSGRVLWAG